MATPPSTFTRTVSDGGSTVTVDFRLHPIRSSNFQVLVQDAQGRFNSPIAPPSRTYVGTVRGFPGALASGLLKQNGTLLCRISYGNGLEWSSTGGTATVRGNISWRPDWPTDGVVGKGGAGSNVYAAEVGVDASHAQYRTANFNLVDTIEMVEYSVMAANVPFLRDAAILHRVGKLVVRSSGTFDPYTSTDTADLLPLVRHQWNNVLPVGKTHQLALLARPGAGGGRAYLGSIGTDYGFSVNGADPNGDFSVIWRHEAGHNWGSNHYEGGGQPEGPTIMSDNALSRFSSSELKKILAHRDTKTNQLANLGPYSFAIPPRANMVTGTFIPGRDIVLNLLENASDSNGQKLTLWGVSSPSNLNGHVRRLPTDGLVSYSPPPGPVSNTDFFTYSIRDSAGFIGLGYVTLRPRFNDDLAAHWTLDDGTATRALETTSTQNHGQLSNGGATWVTGHIGGAIRLDGREGYVLATAPLDLNTNTMTIASWLKRDGTQATFAGIAMCNGNGEKGGLNLGNANELRYHWSAGSNPSHNFDSGLTLPDGTWTFCALVISPSQATIYMKPEGSSQALQSATATGTFSPQTLGAAFYLGYDTHDASRRFKGDIADFRVFRRALTNAEISSLASKGGTPSTPSPFVGDRRLTGSSFDLTWTRAPSSNSFQVFLGTNYSSVLDANTTSPEYIGSSTSATFRPSGSFSSEGVWFWRVDASDGTTTTKGPVWYFHVVDTIPAVADRPPTCSSADVNQMICNVESLHPPTSFTADVDQMICNVESLHQM